MPYDKTTHTVITVIVLKELKPEFKELAKKNIIGTFLHIGIRGFLVIFYLCTSAGIRGKMWNFF